MAKIETWVAERGRGLDADCFVDRLSSSWYAPELELIGMAGAPREGAGGWNDANARADSSLV